MRRLKTERSVRIGVIGSDAAALRGQITNAQLGAIHEFGLGVPRRSFLRDWLDENEAQIVQRMQQAIADTARDKNSNALELVGIWAVGQVQLRIADNIPPPLAESTIARKGSSVALIDTGQLRSSISSEVT